MITFDVCRVDLATTGIGLQDLPDIFGGAENNAPSHFDHPTAFTPFIHLSVTQVGVEDAFRFCAGSAWPWLERRWLRCTVVGD